MLILSLQLVNFRLLVVYDFHEILICLAICVVLVPIGVDRLDHAAKVPESAFEFEQIKKLDRVSAGSENTYLPAQHAVVGIIGLQALPADCAGALLAFDRVYQHFQAYRAT